MYEDGTTTAPTIGPPAPGATPAPATPAAEEPAEPPPPPVWSPAQLWDPAGEPGPCEVAAGAWRRQGGALTALADSLEEIGSPLPDFWVGEAAEGQQDSSVDLIAEIREAAGECLRLADGLDELAGEIKAFNDSIHELWIAAASIAVVSIVGAFVTFGASTAAGAVAAAGLAARAAALGRALLRDADRVAGGAGRGRRDAVRRRSAPGGARSSRGSASCPGSWHRANASSDSATSTSTRARSSSVGCRSPS